MAKRGPATTPNTILKLRGQFRRDRHGDEFDLPGSLPECPDWLDDYAKEQWAALAPGLVERGLLNKDDLGDFLAYCQAMADYKAAMAEIREHGRTQIGEGGRRIKNPAVAHKIAAAAEIKQFAAEFGLSPSARARLGAKPQKKRADSPAAAFFAKKA